MFGCEVCNEVFPVETITESRRLGSDVFYSKNHARMAEKVDIAFVEVNRELRSPPLSSSGDQLLVAVVPGVKYTVTVTYLHRLYMELKEGAGVRASTKAKAE